MYVKEINPRDLTLKTLREKLRKHNIIHINIVFDGSGDSGDYQVFSVTCVEPESDKEIIIDQFSEIDELFCEIGTIYVPVYKYGERNITLMGVRFIDALTHILNNYLPPGCENNDGCLAQFDIDQTKIRLDYAERYSTEVYNPDHNPDDEDYYPDSETHVGESEVTIINWNGEKEIEEEEEEIEHKTKQEQE